MDSEQKQQPQPEHEQFEWQQQSQSESQHEPEQEQKQEQKRDETQRKELQPASVQHRHLHEGAPLYPAVHEQGACTGAGRADTGRASVSLWFKHTTATVATTNVTGFV